MELPTFNHLTAYPDVLTPEEFDECGRMLLRPMWQRTNSNAAMGEECLMWRMDLTKDKFFTKTIFNKIQKLLKRKFEIFDLYANGTTTSMGSFPHIDAREHGVYIFLLYVNPEWRVEWAGHTVFVNKYFDVDTEQEKGTNATTAFLPIPNTALFFPGNIVHLSEAPSREFRGLRQTIAYRLREV